MLRILVVLYNKKAFDSETILSIKNYISEITIDVQLLLWNNSLTKITDVELAFLSSFVSHKMMGVILHYLKYILEYIRIVMMMIYCLFLIMIQ